MRIYTVHLRRRALTPDLVLVKEGFCWPAFLLSVPWALWHRMWMSAVAFMVAAAALGGAGVLVGLDEAGQGVVSLGFAVIVGYLANDLRRLSLARRDFEFRDVVGGDDRTAAERAFLDGRPELLADFRL